MPLHSEIPCDQRASDLTSRAGRTAWVTVIILFLIYVLSYMDRQMLIYMVKPIRDALGITDFQFSLIQGLAFALFFSVLGVPIGWLVDHMPRRRIISCGIAIWSAGTIGCGMATHYWHMILGRIGLAAGEATVSPTTYSMVSDLFPPHKLALALSIVGTGAQIGSLLAAAIAGYIVANVPAAGLEVTLFGHVQGWQVALLAVGVSGLLLAPLIYAVPEPHRRESIRGDIPVRGEVRGLLSKERRFYIGHFLGFGFSSTVGWAVIAWAPTFFIRHHGWDIQQAALATGSLSLIAGLPGTLLMGYVVDRWFASGRHDAHLVFYAGAVLTQAVLIAGAVLVDSASLALALMVPFNALVNSIGISAAALQIVTPSTMRGRVSAIYLLVFNLLGIGLGPMVVAFMTDFVFGSDDQIGLAILSSVAICALLSACFLLSASSRMRAMVVHVDSGRSTNSA